MAKVIRYELSLVADQDIEDIFDYTLAKFGLDQAVQYVSDLERIFQQLIQNSELGKEREEIKHGLRSIPKGSHVIFYRITGDCIRIVRVLHGSRDILKFLE